MKDIAFHITDLVENGIRAEARRIDVRLRLEGRQLLLTIADNGRGMDAETLRSAEDPFFTTRTERRVGLGLPFLFQNAEQCGGGACVRSEPGRGTVVEARFPLDHIDCPPAGDLSTTFMELFAGNPDTDIRIELSAEERLFTLSSDEVREALGNVPAGHPKVARILRRYLAQGLHEVFGKLPD